MNLKAIKTKTQENITNVIKTMVSDNVTVQTFYDLEQEVISVILIEEHKQNETVERIIAYSCVYNMEPKTLSVTGFARRYAYDNFGIAFINNEPVTVDEPFINGIKAGIDAGLNMPLEEAPVETNESAE
jgi:HSP90 family molecular chaperone